MSLMDWLNMNLIFDISAAVFIFFLGYKIRKLNKNQKETLTLLKEVIRNPAAAKRSLNKSK